MIEDVRNTEIWEKLINHPQFNNCIQKCSKYCNVNDLIYEINDNKLIVTYRSKVVNRDLDCQYKSYERTEFYFDEEDNLIVNELSGKVESKYGYSFNDENGVVLKTHYSTRVFDKDGVELMYSCYIDKYMFDSNDFDINSNIIESKILSSFNPHLYNYTNKYGVVLRPEKVGKDGIFMRKIRGKDDFGIIYNTRCYFNRDGNINSLTDDLYFNTMYGSSSKNNPELIHVMNGFPFGSIEKNGNITIYHQYQSLGLTTDNYKEVARDRFLNELKEEKSSIKNNSETSNKYNIMLDKIENEMKIKNRIQMM